MAETDRTDARLAALRQRWEQDPSSRALLQLTEEYRRVGRVQEAIQVLELGLQRQPNNMAAQVALGRCRLETGRLESAIEVLEQVIEGADLFLGLSGANVLKPEMVAKMADQPILFALANPDPEIQPEAARKIRPDAVIATGRSDFPNQVNNVLCFPFIFRGALDAGATGINDEMELACVRAIAGLARAPIAAEAGRRRRHSLSCPYPTNSGGTPGSTRVMTREL